MPPQNPQEKFAQYLTTLQSTMQRGFDTKVIHDIQKSLEWIFGLLKAQEKLVMGSVDEKMQNFIDQSAAEREKLYATIDSFAKRPGEKPTNDELLALIKPLIPLVNDGKTPSKEELLALIKPLIPAVKDGKTPTEEYLTSLILPLIPPAIPGKDGTNVDPETPETLVKKINTTEEAIDMKTISGLRNIIKNIQSALRESRGGRKIGGGSITKKSITFVLDTPTSSDTFPIFQIPYGITITKVWAAVVGGTSVGFNIESRAKDALNSSGTAILASTMTATQTGVSSTSFTAKNNAIATPNTYLVFVSSALSGTVNQIAIEIDYTTHVTS